MDKNTEKLLRSLKNKKVGIFCDDSNLYHAYIKYGWRIDLKKFREFIGRYCDLQFINYYLVIPAVNDIIFRNTQKFIGKIKRFVDIKKERTEIHARRRTSGQKRQYGCGNCFRCGQRKIDELDAVIIVSGDSDFLELKNYMVFENKKNILFVSYEENMAWELRRCWHIYLNRIKDVIILK